jgi:thymidylate synthase ThyX
MSYKCEILADSINPHGNRLTTMLITFPRFILSEFNTHRMFSRNSASSRAIPFQKMIESVKTNPFVPIKWMKKHKGMQGTEYIEDKQEIIRLNNKWFDARWRLMESAEQLHELGVTKQICNRLLEPFMWHTVVVTATEWENFFAQRAHEAAEIHIQEIAYMMLNRMNDSHPHSLKPGEWHIPLGDDLEENYQHELAQLIIKEDLMDINKTIDVIKVKIATARCAQTSYTVVGEEDKPLNLGNLIKLHDLLIEKKHMSPLEHCAQVPIGKLESYEQSNLKGWLQYRKMIEGENQSDKRLIKC